MVGPKPTLPLNLHPEALFERGLTLFEEAKKKNSSTIHFRLRNHTFKVEFSPQSLNPYLCPALEHLICEDSSPADLHIKVWCAQSSNTPLLPAPLFDDDFKARGEIPAFNREGYQTAYQPGARVLSMYRKETREALCWSPNFTTIPQYIRSAPFFSILAWWLETLQLQMVHASALAWESSGFLIAGPSGSGKSTTATSCIGTKLHYLSDDYCILDPLGLNILSLYNSAKLERTWIKQFSRLPNEETHPGEYDPEKALFFLARQYPEVLIPEVPLKAIILPTITSNLHSEFKPISAAQGLLKWAPSTVYQLPGAGHQAFEALAKVAQQIPCYQLNLGQDLDQLHQLFKSLRP